MSITSTTASTAATIALLLLGSIATAQPAADPSSPAADGRAEPVPVAPVSEPVAPVAPVAPAAPRKRVELKPAGYLQVDGRRLLNGSEAHEITVRRLRFDLSGSASPRFKFRTLIDFAGSKVVVKNAWVEYDLKPEFGLRAGKDKSQFGLERLQAATQLTFIERAFPTSISPDRDIGLWARGDLLAGVIHYSVGAVDGVANNAVIEGETDNNLEYNVHVLVSPFARHKELGDLAFGGATTFGRTAGTAAVTGLTNIKSAGQLTIVKYTADATAATAVTSGNRTRVTAHGYYYGGPVGVLAEYVVDREPVKFGGGEQLYTNQAWQLATSLAVTPGDHPTYQSLKPRHALDPSRGAYGAVEVAARYSELRIDKDGIASGITTAKSSAERARELTVGVNWYWTENLKLQVDYTVTTFRGGADTGDRESEQLLATRVQASI